MRRSIRGVVATVAFGGAFVGGLATGFALHQLFVSSQDRTVGREAVSERMPVEDAMVKAIALLRRNGLLLKDEVEVEIKRSANSTGWVITFYYRPDVVDGEITVWVNDDGATEGLRGFAPLR